MDIAGDPLHSLDSYLSQVATAIRQLRENQGITGTFPPEHSHLLRKAVDKCEQTPAFTALGDALEPETSDTPSVFRNVSENLPNFLQRSGVYRTLANGQAVDAAVVWRQLEQVRDRSDNSGYRYLIPLDGVDFEGARQEYDLGPCWLRRFSPAELATVLEQENAALFFSHALVDLAAASEYWYFDIAAAAIENADLRELFGWKLPTRRNRYPPAVMEVLEAVALWPWEDEGDANPIPWHHKKHRPHGSWQGCCIPFVLTQPKSLIMRPWTAPNIAGIRREDVMYEDDTVGERLAYDWFVDAEAFVAHTRALLRLREQVSAVGQRWRFVDVSADFLVHAFLTNGLDQLLGNIVAIEALFGEDTQGLVRLVRGRLMFALGQTSDEEKRIKFAFDQLYKVRSSLVHGAEDYHDNEVMGAHALEARRLARAAFAWTLQYLAALATLTPVPSRAELLSLLDVPAGRVRQFYGVLPSSFPRW